MTTYKTLVNDFCSNDAVIESVAVGVTVYNWGVLACQKGQAARRWWKTDEELAPLIRLAGQVIWLAAVFCWQYFASGKAKQHWEFVNAVVDDGVGVYGPSPMGDAVSAWSLKQVRCLWVASKHTAVYVAQRLADVMVREYGAMQSRVFAA